MPSGLTSGIYDGTGNTFRDFAIRCLAQTGGGWRATHYGDGKLPYDKAPVLAPDIKYHSKELEKAEASLEHWLYAREHPEDVEKEYLDYCAKEESTIKHAWKEDAKIKARYQAMLDKVNAWDAPEQCKGLKDIMVEQLTNSMNYDCGHYEEKKFVRPSIEEWINSHIEHEEWEIKYHTGEIEKEVENVKGTNEYLATVYAEIDKIDPIKPL